MKLAYIVENYGRVSETFVKDLIEALCGNRIDLYLLVDRAVSAAISDSENFHLIETGYASHCNRILRLIGLAGRFFRRKDTFYRLRRNFASRILETHLRNISPDVAYVEFGTNAVLARKALENLQIPFIVHFHGYDASSELGKPWYATEVKEVFKEAERIIVPSHHLRRRLVVAGCLAEKIKVLYHGIHRHLLEAQAGREKKPFSMVFVGRLVEKKNPVALLESFRLVRGRVPEATLSILGDGPLRPELERRIADYGIERSVTLCGTLPIQEVMKEMSQHCVYVQHSVTASNGDQEGFSVSILEAAACGLPVVSTFHDGIPENVLNGETGFLVREYDYETMAERIICLLTNSDMMEKMGSAGRERVEKYFQFQQRVEKILEILKTITS